MNGAKQIIGYRYLRALACIAVIIMHTVNSAEILYRDSLGVTQIGCSLAVVYIMMWAVPCFLMVTGALLLNPKREMSLKKIGGKYLFRVGVALVLCVVCFRLFDALMNGEAFSVAIFGEMLNKLVTGTSWAHLWYLYLLIGIYLLLPFYRMIAAHCKPAVMKYLLIVLFVFLSLLPLLKMFGWEPAFTLHLESIFPLYVFLGYAVSRDIFRLKKTWAWLVLIIGTALTVLFTALRYGVEIEALDGLLTSYGSFCVLLQSWGIFSLCLTAKGSGNRIWQKILLFIDENCFGIYLLHMVWIRLVLRYWAINPYEIGIWFFPVFIILNLAVTALIVALLRRIPGVKRVL